MVVSICIGWGALSTSYANNLSKMADASITNNRRIGLRCLRVTKGRGRSERNAASKTVSNSVMIFEWLAFSGTETLLEQLVGQFRLVQQPARAPSK